MGGGGGGRYWLSVYPFMTACKPITSINVVMVNEKNNNTLCRANPGSESVVANTLAKFMEKVGAK